MILANKIINLIEAGLTFSDLQIKPNEPMMYRSPKGYVAWGNDAVTPEHIKEFAEFADPKWKEKIEHGQFDVAATLKGQCRLRCNFYRFGHDNDMGFVARKHDLHIPKLDALGIPTKLRHLVNVMPKGLILVTGPFGSGKTTTIASMLDHINEKMGASIVTLEDPIEYVIQSKKSVITQREVPTNVPTFSDGLMAAKRQRPDVIMVGEMRDRDTIEAGIMAADSGCLVMASTHGRSAVEAIETLLSYFSGAELEHKRRMLANSVVAIISQSLLPSVDGTKFVLAYEMLVNNPSASNLIREGKLAQLANNISTSNSDGSVLLNVTLADLVNTKQVDQFEATMAAYDKEELRKLIKR